MPSFLLIGLAWSELPVLPTPPGVSHAQLEERIRAGLAISRKRFEDRGAEFELYNAGPDTTGAEVEGMVRKKRWDGILIGGGIRMNAKYTDVFERLVNTARIHAPQATLIFNTQPDNAFEAAKRWFPDL